MHKVQHAINSIRRAALLNQAANKMPPICKAEMVTSIEIRTLGSKLQVFCLIVNSVSKKGSREPY